MKWKRAYTQNDSGPFACVNGIRHLVSIVVIHLVATHSPLVMASSETLFDQENEAEAAIEAAKTLQLRDDQNRDDDQNREEVLEITEALKR